jgi:hypothetical protein
VLLPARAHGLVISAAARALGLLADLLGDWLAVLAGGKDQTRITQLQDDIHAAMPLYRLQSLRLREQTAIFEYCVEYPSPPAGPLQTINYTIKSKSLQRKS